MMFHECSPSCYSDYLILTAFVWTGATTRTTLSNMRIQDARLLPERPTPWLIHDLPRIAWVVEYRTPELTDEERQLVHDAGTRMLHALEQDTV
jgi:hypothetical protein